MKKNIYLSILLFLISFSVFSQVPENFNYQAVVRNSAGELIVEKSINVKVTILDGTENNDILYTESHQKTTNAYGIVNLKIGDGTNKIGVFSDINWAENQKFLKIEVDAGNGYSDLGSVQLLSVPYALYANSASQADALGEKNVYSTSSDTLFVVKDHSGNVVFAVYPDGAQVYVNSAKKGNLGGFAVSGRGATKGDIPYLTVSPDSTRVYIDQTAKGNLGGFAVSGRGATKGSTNQFLNLTPQNYFIGHRAGEAMVSGLYNTFIGYEAGLQSYWGNGNLFLGFNAGRGNLVGQLNVFIGNEAGYSFTGEDDGEENVFIGNAAGKNISTVANSIFIGTQSGLNCGTLTVGNTFVGDRTGANGSIGSYNTLIGASAGFHSNGEYNVYLGSYAGQANANGVNNTFVGTNAGTSSSGNNSVFIGYNAGKSEVNSNRLHIANNATTSLIYGEFDNETVLINGALEATGEILSGSDLNLKTNLIPLTSGLSMIKSLTAYYFDWKPESIEKYHFKDKRQIGIIAQDVEKVLPELVSESSNGYKTVDYTKLTPVLIEAIKEQQTKIEQLENDNKVLLERIKKLEEIILK